MIIGWVIFSTSILGSSQVDAICLKQKFEQIATICIVMSEINQRVWTNPQQQYLQNAKRLFFGLFEI